MFEPVVLIAHRRLGAEIDVVGAVIVFSNTFGLAADGRENLTGLEHRAGLVVIHRQRQKSLAGGFGGRRSL